MSDLEATQPIPAPAPASAPAAQPHTPGRTITTVICIVLAALLTTPAVFAYWGQRTLNDTQRYVDTVGPLVRSPAVQDAIATNVTDAIQRQVDVKSLLNDVFAGVITDRPRLKELVGPIAAAVNGLIDRQVRDFIASKTFETIWIAVNTKAQEALHQVLSGNSTGAVSIQGDQVVLDLGTVITQVKQQLVDRGLTFVANAPIPTFDRQIVLLDAPQLKQVRTIYAFSNPVAKWLIWFVVVLYFGAMLLARRRPRMAVIIGAVLAVNALILALLLATGRQLFVNELAGTVFGPASSVFYNQLLTYLVRGRKVLLWLGLLIIFMGWFAGAHSSGNAARKTISGSLEDAGATLSGGPVDGVAKWVAGNARWLRYVIGVLGALILLWGNSVSLTKLFWAGVVVVVLMAAVQALIGTANGEPRPPRQALATAGAGGGTGSASDHIDEPGPPPTGGL